MSQPLLARELKAEQWSSYDYGISVARFCVSMISLGLDTITLKFCSIVCAILYPMTVIGCCYVLVPKYYCQLILMTLNIATVIVQVLALKTHGCMEKSYCTFFVHQDTGLFHVHWSTWLKYDTSCVHIQPHISRRQCDFIEGTEWHCWPTCTRFYCGAS